MMLRKDLIELLEEIEPGLVWKWHIDPEKDSKLLYLRDEKYIQAREDLKPGLLCLTELGKCVLEQARQQRREAAEQRRREEDAEAVRLQERREDTAAAERRYRGQNCTAIIAAVISGSLGFILGMVSERYLQIFQVLFSFFH